MCLYDHHNQPILLGEEVGRGGEGSVYTIQGDIANVAKVYHQPIASARAEKLQVMVANTPDVARFIAWPSATLHQQPRSTIQGFIMPRVTGHKEVHELYGPAHRRAQFPHADWAFLIHAARNVAAAFQAIHDCGHIIGDVNQSGILISQQAVCHLIDTDSFQIRLGNQVYYCEVGTPHLTPPELQSGSFQGILRRKNHDNFGLAVIIFQLLFMGRHPFAGRYLGSGEMPIERAIKEYRFAFGSRASARQMAPPPNALDLSVCTPSVGQLFERAFSEEASRQGNRPIAQEWVRQLDALRSGLRPCSQNSVHTYHRNLNSCPWCRLENATGTVFFLPRVSTGSTQTNFNLEAVWLTIQAIRIPSLDSLPDASSIRVMPTPLPDYAKPPTGFLGVVNFFFNVHNDGGKRNRRESLLRQAEQEWQNIERRWQTLNSDPGFNSSYRILQNAYSEYNDLPNQYQTERRSALLKIYLGRSFIENAGISNIGRGRALVLASYGIETAADISYGRVSSIPGFGSVLTQKLVDWRNTLEVSFQQYRPSPQDLAALNAVDQKYARRRSALESTLLGGEAQLEHGRATLIGRRNQVRNEAESAARKLAQGRADMRVYT